MKYKDIVNRDIINLTNCDHEPIHIPGSIQPHGFLLGLKIGDFSIEFCSENSFEFIGKTYSEVLTKSFDSIFGAVETEKLKHYISSIDELSQAPLEIEIHDKLFACTTQIVVNVILLEFEIMSRKKLAIADIYLQTRQFTFYMQTANTLQMFCQSIADETRVITGYDRVMIYRFDEDYNGEVFAESRIESVEPFLGLHYPHTDIPVQARALYLQNLLRQIVDVDYTPVPIYTVDDGVNKNLNLGVSTLRSVSPIHIAYLQNMGVSATLTISLVYENKLWGLIACHHYSPKHLTNEVKIAAQLQGHYLTSQISVRQLAEEYIVTKNVNKSLDDLLNQVFSSDSITLEKMIQQKQLLTLTNSSSVIILVDGVIYSHGKVPDEDKIRELANWLNNYNSQLGLSTANLSALYPEAAKLCDTAAGIIYHSLGSGKHNCIIWCRAEALQEVYWGGNPKTAIIKDEKGLSPRKSFEQWKEVKKCESNPWQKSEIFAAGNFANALQKNVHMMFLAKEELRHRKLSEKLREANAELENLNWIGSHDLHEPLRKIQLFASRILNKDHSTVNDDIIHSVKKMNESANRMQVLIEDIISYSRIGNVEESFEAVNLNTILKNIINELDFEISEKSATINVENLPDVKGISFLLKQLLINVIRNALKFSKANENCNINISYKESVNYLGTELPLDQKFIKIIIRDNGIGFDNQFKESIFKVFTKLHSNSQFSGSGVGLALCKKIMKSHNGFITAEGKPEVGTTISLYFPQ